MNDNINRIDNEIVRKIISDIEFKNELKAFLNEIIDEEIAKGDEMDDELISECVDALMRVDNGEMDEVLEKLGDNKKIIKFVHKKNFQHNNMTRSVAAVIALVLLTSGVTLKTNPVLAEKAKDFFNQIINALQLGDEETDDGTMDVVALYGVFDETPDYTVKDESEIDLSSLKVYALDENSNETEIPLEKCKVTKKKLKDKTITVIVSYKGASFSVNYTIKD